MGFLLEHHRAVADPFGRGHTAPQMGLMMFVTRGLKVPFVNGAVILLRRKVYPDPTTSPWQYVGWAVGSASQIKNYPGMGHDADQGYIYSAVRMLGNGMVSQAAEPVRLDFDGAGNLITPLLPNWPVNLIAEPIAGGKFAIVWEYVAYGHGAYPADFQVFEGATPGTVNYATPLVDSETGLNVVAIEGDRRVYRFTTAAYANRSTHVFAVRSRNSGGVAELNSFTTATVKARSVTPADASAIISGHVQPRSRMGVRT